MTMLILNIAQNDMRDSRYDQYDHLGQTETHLVFKPSVHEGQPIRRTLTEVLSILR